MENSAGAEEMLREADRVRHRVLRQGPREWVIQASWAVWVLVFIPPFDVVRGAIWGPVVLVSSAAGTALTWRYYATRRARVRPMGPTPWQVWVVWSVWYIGWVVFANVMKNRVATASLIAAVAAATPLLAYAVLLRHRDQTR